MVNQQHALQLIKDINRSQFDKSHRYYISSLNLDANIAADAVCSHWAVENELHWVLDVSFREDEFRIRRGDAAEVTSTFRRLTLNLLKKNTTSNASLKRKCKIVLMGKKSLTEIIDGILNALAQRTFLKVNL